MAASMMRGLRPAVAAVVATLAAALWMAGPAHAAPAAADFDATVRYETRQVMASGVTRIDTWQERVVRRGSQVWSERVLPADARALHAQEEAAEHAAHKHFNAETAARWISVGPKGEGVLKFVDHDHRYVVNVPRAEYASVGFDGRFDAAGAIVPPAAIRAMKAEPGGTPARRWHMDRGQGWVHRVLWSDTMQLALRVESRREDGSFSRQVRVDLKPRAADTAPPWAATSSYAQKQYDDFMD
jgi:hypothetical protein